MSRATRDRGAAAVEFALVLPLLLILVFGIIDFGFMVNRASLINNAARDGAREGSLHGTKSEVAAVATAALGGVPGATVAVTCKKPDASACGVNYDAAIASGGTTVVTITYVHEMITPIGYLFGDSLELSRKVEMRIE